MIFYIKDENGHVKEVDEATAKSHTTYGTKDEENGHIFKNHSHCEDPACYVCNLGVCWVCGALEGGLTTECCGEVLSAEETDSIYKGEKDFRYGKWIKGVVSKIMTKDINTLIRNQKILSEVFSDDIDNKTELGERIRKDIADEIRIWGKYKVIK